MDYILGINFPLPCQKAVTFDGILKVIKLTKVETTEAQEKIQQTNKARIKLYTSVEEQRSPKEVVTSCEEYIPMLMGLVEVVNKQITEVHKASSIGIRMFSCDIIFRFYFYKFAYPEQFHHIFQFKISLFCTDVVAV
jgi:hypothetical protein